MYGTSYTVPAERARAAVPNVSVDGDTPGRFEAVASARGSIANGANGPTRFAEGAFRPCVVPLLWQHRDDAPIGTARLRVTDAGLVATCQLALGTRQADEAHALLKAGAINGVSIGFTPRSARMTSEMHNGRPVRLVTEADVLELSVVTFPADQTARVIWVHKSRLERVCEYLNGTDHDAIGSEGRRAYEFIRDLQRRGGAR